MGFHSPGAWGLKAGGVPVVPVGGYDGVSKELEPELLYIS